MKRIFSYWSYYKYLIILKILWSFCIKTYFSPFLNLGFRKYLWCRRREKKIISIFSVNSVTTMDSFSGSVNLAIISHGIASSHHPSPALLWPATAQLLTTATSRGASVLGLQPGYNILREFPKCGLKNWQNHKKNLSKIEKRTETPLTGKRHLHKIIIWNHASGYILYHYIFQQHETRQDFRRDKICSTAV